MNIQNTKARVSSSLNFNTDKAIQKPVEKIENRAQEQPVDRLDGLSSLWNDVDPEPVSLPKSRPPALQRPVVFVHGFNSGAGRWDNITEWLTSGEEPVNKSGGIVKAGEFENLDPDANLFSLDFSRPFNSVETNTAELKAAVEAILEKTGAEEVDLVVHSLGGLDSRDYLRDDDEKVNKLVMLGTPNHGSQLANLERFFREKFDFPTLPPVDDAEVRRVIDQLSVDKLNGKKEPKNPWLRELNEGWKQQREKADIMIVAGAGIPTLTGRPGITIFGDGVVTRKSAKLSGVKRKTSWFRTHGGLQNSAKVMENTAKFLVGAELDAGEHLFDSPEDALKATELVLKQQNGRAPIQKASLEEAQKAKRLPVLDPAFQMGLALGVLSSVMGGPKENLPFVEIGLRTNSQESSIEAEYNIDLSRENNHLQGSGTVDGDPFLEVADFQEGDVHWKSAVGIQSSGLSIEVGEDEKSVTMKGAVGGVPTDLKINMLYNESGMMSGILTEGLFNEEEYSMQSNVDMAGILADKPRHHGAMHVTGVVNGETMKRDYNVDVHKSDTGLELRAHASTEGLNAESLGVTVKVIDRE